MTANGLHGSLDELGVTGFFWLWPKPARLPSAYVAEAMSCLSDLQQEKIDPREQLKPERQVTT